MLTFQDLVIPVYEPDSAAVAAGLLQVESARHRQHAGLPAGSVRGHRSSSEPTAPAAWLGSAAALAELGLTAELDVSLDRLALALQGRHVRSLKSVRGHVSTVRPSAAEVGGIGTAPDARSAVIQIELTLRMPERVTDRWRESGPGQRAMIERALLRNAETAIAQMVLDRQVARAWPSGRLAREAPVGFAAVAAVHGVREPTTPVIEPAVRAVLLGVQRGDGKLVGVDPMEIRRTYVRDEAERVAWRALADEPSLRYAGRQAVAAVRAFERPPAPAEVSPRPGLPRRDPLEGWRKLVGDRRAERVGARADELGERMATLPYVELVAERQALRAEFTPRDRATARRALSLERDLDKHDQTLAAARHDIAAFKAAARLGTRERAHIMQAVKTIESNIWVDELVHDTMLTADRRQAARDRLDAWMTENGEQVAQMVTIDRRLLARLYRRIEREVSHALDDPPDYVHNAIGNAPEAASPEHDAWIATTTKLVHAHYVEAANRAVGYELLRPDAREQRALEAEVRGLRVRRGLESVSHQRTIERRSLGPDMAA